MLLPQLLHVDSSALLPLEGSWLFGQLLPSSLCALATWMAALRLRVAAVQAMRPPRAALGQGPHAQVSLQRAGRLALLLEAAPIAAHTHCR